MTLRMRVLPRFPATIYATNGLKVTRPEGTPNLTIEPDFGSLVQIPSVDNPEEVFFWAWDRNLQLYRIMSFADLFEGVSSLGFMDQSVYDPTGKNADAFNLANHYGNLVMTGVIENAIFASPGANTKRAHFDLASVTAGQDRAIFVPDTTGLALSKWEAIPGSGPFSAVSSLAFTNLSAYEAIKITLRVTPTNAGGIIMRTSSNNGSSYDSGASDYNNQIWTMQGTTGAASFVTATQISMSGFSLDAATSATIELIMTGFNAAIIPRAVSRATGVSTGSPIFSQGGTSRGQATARNAFQIASAGGGTISGNILVEGVRS